MKKTLKIGITGINPLNSNRGVGALAISAVYLLQKMANETNSNIEIFAINQHQSKYSIRLNNETLSFRNIPAFDPFRVKSLVKIFLQPKYIKSIKEYIKLDIILSVGEGDSFSDIYGETRFNYINNQHRLARLFRKKYALLPQTIGPFKNAVIQQQAKKSLEKAEFVLARDKQSYDYILQSTKQKNISEVVDMALFMPFKKKSFKDDFIHVGLNVSGLLWHGGYTKNNQFSLKCDYQDLTNKIIGFFTSLPNVKLHIVSHVVSQDSKIENDYEVAYNIVETFNTDNLILAPFFINPIQAKSYISGFDFFLGARMHAAIAAFSAGVPVFPLAYSRKFNGLFVDTLNYNHMGDMVNQEPLSMLKQIEQAFNQKHILAKEIKHILNTTVVFAEMKQRKH